MNFENEKERHGSVRSERRHVDFAADKVPEQLDEGVWQGVKVDVEFSVWEDSQ